MIRFFNNDIFTDPGSPLKVTYDPIIDEKGNIKLVESGVINTDEEIQSYAESCDINIILYKYLNGDESVLNQKKGMFGDFTNMPKTYAEFLQKSIDAEKVFNKLPIDVKVKFDNDINKFIATAGSDEWFNKLSKEKKVSDNVEVKVDE